MLLLHHALALALALQAPTSRKIAHGVLLRCLRDGAFADRALSSALDRAPTLDRGDRAHATELVYGVLRHTSALDYSLKQLATLNNRTKLGTSLALRIGAYELLHMRTPDHAAVDQAVSLVQQSAQRRFVNGVLRNMARKRDTLTPPSEAALPPLTALAIATSTPEWLLSEVWNEELLPSLEEVSAWARATQQPPLIALRANACQGTRAALAAALRADGVDADVEGADGVLLDGAILLGKGAGDVSRLPGFESGLFCVQDVGAQCVALLARPPVGGLVVDLCAAPGGKTTHLAELMEDKGTLISVEIHPTKAKLIKQACDRLQLSCVQVSRLDTTSTRLDSTRLNLDSTSTRLDLRLSCMAQVV